MAGADVSLGVSQGMCVQLWLPLGGENVGKDSTGTCESQKQEVVNANKDWN